MKIKWLHLKFNSSTFREVLYQTTIFSDSLRMWNWMHATENLVICWLHFCNFWATLEFFNHFVNFTEHRPTNRPNTRFFYKQRFFSAQPQCCLIFSWIELQMLLRCCIMHITIIILKYILYLEYLFWCLGLALFMLYICDLFFNFILGFLVINHVT